MDEHKIDTLIQLGDLYDRRKYINFNTLSLSRKYFFTPLKERNTKTHIFCGNHDVFYKNSNEINSVELLQGEYENITTYVSPTDITIGDMQLAILPWICADNQKESMKFIKSTKAEVLLGHLELQGFEMYKGTVNEHGLHMREFDKFDMVFSGHFHHKSSSGNIHYLGTPYEITWGDWNDPRGFHIFDTQTRELTFIENPYKMFNKVIYDDSLGDMETVLDIDVEKLSDSYVKVIVKCKNNPYWFDLFIDKIDKQGVYDLQVVEDNYNLNLENDEEIVEDVEDTLTVLKNVVEQIETNHDKKKLSSFLSSLYNEAMSLS
jgi:DNA repair exonuclease SbcCD nuclease subunit